MAGSKTPAKTSKAKGKKATERKTPTVAEQAQRNAEIVAAKARGLGWTQISATYGLTVRRCQQIVREWRDTTPTLREQDPIAIIDEVVEGYLADVEELVLIGATASSDAARVGAVNARMSARQKITELLQAVGVLPHDLGSMRVEIDARFTAQRIVAVLNEYNVPDEVRDALVAALENKPDQLAAAVIEGDAVEEAA